MYIIPALYERDHYYCCCVGIQKTLSVRNYLVCDSRTASEPIQRQASVQTKEQQTEADINNNSSGTATSSSTSSNGTVNLMGYVLMCSFKNVKDNYRPFIILHVQNIMFVNCKLFLLYCCKWNRSITISGRISHQTGALYVRGRP